MLQRGGITARIDRVSRQVRTNACAHHVSLLHRVLLRFAKNFATARNRVVGRHARTRTFSELVGVVVDDAVDFLRGPLRRSGGHVGRSSSELSLPPSSVIGNQRLYDRKSVCLLRHARARDAVSGATSVSQWHASASRHIHCQARGTSGHCDARFTGQIPCRDALPRAQPRHQATSRTSLPVAMSQIPRDQAIGLDVGHRDCFTWRRRGGVLPRHFRLICHCSAACGLPNSQVRATGAARDCPRCQWAGGQAHMTRSASTPSATTPLRGA